MDNLKNFRRTNYCGDLRLGDTGKTVSLCGWVQRQRDLGGLIFVDLRDRTGLVQLSFDDGTDQAVFEKASSLRSEYVIAATGTVRERESKTDKIATGAIEVYVTELRLLAKAETPPFEIVEHSKANDMLRLKYRYLDLRRPDMQKMIATRLRKSPGTTSTSRASTRSRPPCSPSPPPRAPGTIWSPPGSTPASSTPCPSPLSSISSC